MSELLPDGTVPEAPARRGRPAWWVLAIGVLAVGVAVLVIAAVAPSLAGLISPAGPPVFQPSTLLEHRNTEYGVDEWRYATNLSGCEVYRWYQAQAELVSHVAAGQLSGGGGVPVCPSTKRDL